MDFHKITDEKLNYYVYAHVNKINGKVYIGITKELKRRWGSDGYFYQGCPKFYRAIQKYGWDNFMHLILIDGISKDMALEIEAFLINKYNTIDNGYNIILKHSASSYPQCVKIHQYDFEGNYIKSWNSIIDAINKYGYGINDALKGRVKSAHGYQWRYDYAEKIEGYTIERDHTRRMPEQRILCYSTDGKLQNIYETYDDIHVSKLKKRAIRALCEKTRCYILDNCIWVYEEDANAEYINTIIQMNDGMDTSKYQVIQYDLGGNFVNKFASLNEVVKRYGFTRSVIKSCCDGNSQIGFGYQWRYECDYKPDQLKRKTHSGIGIIQKNPDGTFLQRYSSAMEATRIYGNCDNPNSTTILNACNNYPKLLYGYLWQFEDDYLKEV